jgi:hypothetical protein
MGSESLIAVALPNDAERNALSFSLSVARLSEPPNAHCDSIAAELTKAAQSSRTTAAMVDQREKSNPDIQQSR